MHHQHAEQREPENPRGRLRSAQHAHEPRDDAEQQYPETEHARLREQVDEDVVRVVGDLDAAQFANEVELIARKLAPADAEQRMRLEHHPAVFPQREARRDLVGVLHPLCRRLRKIQVIAQVRPADRDVHGARTAPRARPGSTTRADRACPGRRTLRPIPAAPARTPSRTRRRRSPPSAATVRATRSARVPRRRSPTAASHGCDRQPPRLHEVERARHRERDVGGEVVRLSHVAERPALDHHVIGDDERRELRLDVEQLRQPGKTPQTARRRSAPPRSSAASLSSRLARTKPKPACTAMNAASRYPPPSQFIDGCATGSSSVCAISSTPNSKRHERDHRRSKRDARLRRSHQQHDSRAESARYSASALNSA